MHHKIISSLIGFLLLTIICDTSLSSERIISVGGSITEILYELNLEDSIIAIDTTSQYPPSTQDLPNIGYVRALSAEPIIALGPDLILYQDDAGPPETIETLSSTNITMAKISDQPSKAGITAKIQEISVAVNKEEDGQVLIERINNEFAQLDAFLKQFESSPKILFILNFDEGSALVAGKDTGADGIISIINGTNVIDSFNSYKPLGAESILTLNPDVILTTHRSIKSIGNLEDVANLPVLKLTKAAQNKNIIAMDGLQLLGFGPRTATTAKELAQKIHSLQ